MPWFWKPIPRFPQLLKWMLQLWKQMPIFWKDMHYTHLGFNQQLFGGREVKIYPFTNCQGEVSEVTIAPRIKKCLGRGGCNKISQNTGIAKIGFNPPTPTHPGVQYFDNKSA